MGRLNITQDSQGVTTAPTTGGGRLTKALQSVNDEAIQPVSIAQPKQPGFLARTADNVVDLVKPGGVTPLDVVKEIPGEALNMAKGFAETFVPALTKFFKTTGSIFGEGIAYAVDPLVKQQYTEGSPGLIAMQDKVAKMIQEKKARGEDTTDLNAELSSSYKIPSNLDILPTVTNTTQAKLAKYTLAAGIETAMYRSMPSTLKMGVLKRFGAGGLQGVGLAIADGLANDKSPEEIWDSMKQYGVMGGVLETVAPYMMPLLKAEVKNLPAEVKGLFKGLKNADVAATEGGVKLGVKSEEAAATRVPVSTPNSRYEEYLRSQGYEPYVANEHLPSIDVGGKPKSELPTIQIDEMTGKPSTKVKGDVQFVPEKPVAAPQAGFEPPKAGEPAFQPTVSRETPAQGGEPIIQTDNIAPESRVTRISRDNMPVSGEGAVRVSRLEARMKQTLDSVKPEAAEASGLSTYRAMNKAEQIRAASEFVEKSPEDAMAILKGEKSAPEGLLHNSIALALEKKAETMADAQLATKLASLRSTRAGQEISILTEADPTNVVSNIREIIEARSGKAERSLKGEKPAMNVAKTKAEVATKLKEGRLKLAQAEKVLDSILC